MYYSTCVMSAGVEQGGMALQKNLFAPHGIFSRAELPSLAMKYIPGIKKMLLSNVFLNCWNVFSCKGDQTLSSWLLWAGMSSQTFTMVRQTCNKSPLWAPFQAEKLRTEEWSHLDGCTSHTGNQTPLSLSEVYAASALLSKPLMYVLQLAWRV